MGTHAMLAAGGPPGCQRLAPSPHPLVQNVVRGRPSARPSKRQRLSAHANGDVSSKPVTALQSGYALARLRARETAGEAAPLIADPFAALLATSHQVDGADDSCAPDTDLATLLRARFIDDNVLAAVGSVNTSRQQDYYPVVLVGDGMCTRAFRLPWPSGTAFYLVAPAEVNRMYATPSTS